MINIIAIASFNRFTIIYSEIRNLRNTHNKDFGESRSCLTTQSIFYSKGVCARLSVASEPLAIVMTFAVNNNITDNELCKVAYIYCEIWTGCTGKRSWRRRMFAIWDRFTISLIYLKINKSSHVSMIFLERFITSFYTSDEDIV